MIFLYDFAGKGVHVSAKFGANTSNIS